MESDNMSSDDESLYLATNDYFENDELRSIAVGKEQLVEKEFYKCEFENCTFIESNVSKCVFEDCIFVRCDLTMAKPQHTAYRGVVFRDCKLMGINWSECSPGLDVAFEHCVLSFSSFVGLSLPKTRFIDCTAKEVSFIETDLKQADFRGTNLAGSRFFHVDLTKADLSEAVDYYVQPMENTITKARFSVQAAVALAESFGVIVVG